MLQRRSLIVPFTVATIAPWVAIAQEKWAPPTEVDLARVLLDEHFGRRDRLERAGQLLHAAYDKNLHSAELFVQAARLAIKGGHLSFSEFEPGTLTAYSALLDIALALDSANAKARILKAEALRLTGDLAGSKSHLDAAQKLQTSDPWLWMGYAHYFEALDNLTEQRRNMDRVPRPAVDTQTSFRNAYVAALEMRLRMEPLQADPAQLRKIATEIRSQRHPEDAWPLGNVAHQFNHRAYFIDGADFAREALQIMNYGAARRTLAISLYGRAAQLVASGEKDTATPLIAEAKRLRVPRESILQGFNPRHPDIRRVLETLPSIVE